MDLLTWISLAPNYGVLEVRKALTAPASTLELHVVGSERVGRPCRPVVDREGRIAPHRGRHHVVEFPQPARGMVDRGTEGDER